MRSVLILLSFTALLGLCVGWSACEPQVVAQDDDGEGPPGNANNDGNVDDPKQIVEGGGGDTVKVDVPKKFAKAVQELGEVDTASAAVETLTKAGAEVCELMKDLARHDEDMTRRGRAVEVLARITDDCADNALQDIQRYRAAPDLVRTWAAAGLINRAKTLEQLAEYSELLGQFPAVARPLEMRAADLMDATASVDELLTMAVRMPKLQSALNNILAAKPMGELTASMLSHSDMNARRHAAAILGGAVGSDANNQAMVAAQYAFSAGAAKVLWDGGPLYVPGVNWQRDPARELITNLVSWYLFCDLAGNDEGKNQVYNNLRSIGLLNPAGFSWMNHELMAILTQYKQVMGEDKLRSILKAQGAEKDPRFASLLSKKVTR